ncbi:MAG: ribonuclease Y [bacterium]
MNPNLIYIVTPVAAVVAFVLGWVLQRSAAAGRVRSAKDQAVTILEEAKREAEAIKRTSVLEAKDEWLKAKEAFDIDADEKRQAMSRAERKYLEREAGLNRKVDVLEKKETEQKRREKDLSVREKEVKEKGEKLDAIVREQNTRLERIAGMSAQEARDTLVKNLESEVRMEAGRMAREIRDNARMNAEKEARKVIVTAIQRCAADHAAETTVSVVTLPSDEMKGRIIGREGRNIRAFETATGIDVIIDDTPEAVILSGFDPVRREVARMALERLIQDGRIHPGRIEELVLKVQKEMEDTVREIGDQTVLELGMLGMHPDLITLLGKLKYRTSYGQNVLNHSKEVAYLTGIMAAELHLDQSLAKRAGLLHDIGKAISHETDGTHPQIGGDIAERCGEHPEVLNAIRGHHGDIEPLSFITPLVMAADAISGARPGARGESLQAYIKRLTRLEEIAESFKGVEKSYAIQAGREIRIMVENKTIGDEGAAVLATEIARKVERELEYPGQIKVVVIRETRIVEYAK